MSNKLNGFLGDLLNGFFDPKGNLGDYQHASRLYVDDTFRLAPKTKFLYYAVFNINQAALQDVSFQDRHQLELNYLVKSMDLPKYTIETTNLNQYNRKTNIYTKITYDPINITLHDDNNGITNSLWALYYGYYFADRLNTSDPYSTVAPEAYMRNTYDPKVSFPFRYGLDNDSQEPFFNSIQLFTLSRQRFFSYLLCNPKITSWQHDNMDQNEGGGIVENKMTIAYDAVIYNSGVVDANAEDPAGFAVLHYDNTPSPIVNEEILQTGIEGIFGDLFGLSSFSGPNTYLYSTDINPYNNLGYQSPYGYGTPYYYSNQKYYSSAGGLRGYNFGSNNLSTALTVAGVGLAVNGIGAAINGIGNFFSPNTSAPTSFDNSDAESNSQRTSAINQNFSGVSDPNSNGNNRSVSDIYGPQLPGGNSANNGSAETVSSQNSGSIGTAAALRDAERAQEESTLSNGTEQSYNGQTSNGPTNIVDQQPIPEASPNTELASNEDTSDWGNGGYAFGA
jgi:hypothetical protein